MIKPLRKKHLQAWSILAVLLPLGIASAWLSIVKPAYDKLFQPGTNPALPVVVKTIQKTNHTVNLRTNAEHQSFQLEWVNREALTVPSSLIYQTTNNSDNIQQAAIIGRIDPRGTYHFSLKNDTTGKGFHFIVYDIVHHQVIEQINF